MMLNVQVTREEGSNAPQEKPKRGRPPKKHQPLATGSSITTSDDEDIPMIVKRKPGRPKKHEVWVDTEKKCCLWNGRVANRQIEGFKPAKRPASRLSTVEFPYLSNMFHDTASCRQFKSRISLP